MEVDRELTDEEYVVQRAKEALKIDPYSAKAWMLTAKSLYPNNFTVQFEAYLIEKAAGNVKEAAKCFSDLIGKFQQTPELFKEVEKVTVALRSEADTEDPEKQFLCEMFRHISSEVQHKLLLFTADHCEDTMEHCRLLLLLLQRFPTAISSYGPRLVDTLMSAEKHSVDGHQPINPYRKLLVGELLPLLAKQEVKLDLSTKLLLKLLNKSLEYYLCCLGKSCASVQESESSKENIWHKLFFVVEFVGKQLSWDANFVNFTVGWSKEGYWQKVLSYWQLKSKTLLHYEDKQLIFCLSVFFLYCLHEYIVSLVPDQAPGQTATPYCLVEAFIDPTLPNPACEPKNKKRKGDTDLIHNTNPHISVEKSELKVMQSNFLMCVNCWDLIFSSENLHREFLRIYSYLKLDSWLSVFIIDYALYRARYDEALLCLQKITENHVLLQKYIRVASILYIKKNYRSCLEPLLLSLPLLPKNNHGSLSSGLITGGNQRHLHYLPVTRMAVLQYLVKLLLRCIKENMGKHDYSELSIGHIFVLVQLDWPQEEDFIPPLLEEIKQHRSFQYHLFQNYIINVDIMEELTYLWTPQGGQINLEILPNFGSQRRIGTRGADKGAKEELRQAIRRQVARSNERLDDLLISFLQNERALILQALV
ncbi:integrator complex subunit 10 [Anthonomus grandis grandis]|uniref:integrator complex subunit 10 n=1 Tax=Anthonomus grandis grandis TaxID=2921223 RepID=UPI002165862D|nr:integrator complex subunit 10 [Anthonomus grandis grandis]